MIWITLLCDPAHRGFFSFAIKELKLPIRQTPNISRAGSVGAACPEALAEVRRDPPIWRIFSEGFMRESLVSSILIPITSAVWLAANSPQRRLKTPYGVSS